MTIAPPAASTAESSISGGGRGFAMGSYIKRMMNQPVLGNDPPTHLDGGTPGGPRPSVWEAQQRVPQKLQQFVVDGKWQ